jgi:hypothetical protein
LVLDFLRVIADDDQPDAYAALMRVAYRSIKSEDEGFRLDQRMKRLLRDARAAVRGPASDSRSPEAWHAQVREFLKLATRPVLVALSPEYRQGTWLDQVVENALDAFDAELAVDGEPAAALKRLSETDSVRILTIHKCKGLEFDKVVVLGVEEELFWGKEAMPEFFVAISRAKNHLVLTTCGYRERPAGFTKRWDEYRTDYERFLEFARDD